MWFVLLLVLGLFSFGLVAMIAYVIAGPDGTRRAVPSAIHAAAQRLGNANPASAPKGRSRVATDLSVVGAGRGLERPSSDLEGVLTTIYPLMSRPPALAFVGCTEGDRATRADRDVPFGADRKGRWARLAERRSSDDGQSREPNPERSEQVGYVERPDDHATSLCCAAGGRRRGNHRVPDGTVGRLRNWRDRAQRGRVHHPVDRVLDPRNRDLYRAVCHRKSAGASTVEVEGPAFTRYLFHNTRAGLLGCQFDSSSASPGWRAGFISCSPRASQWAPAGLTAVPHCWATGARRRGTRAAGQGRDIVRVVPRLPQPPHRQ